MYKSMARLISLFVALLVVQEYAHAAPVIIAAVAATSVEVGLGVMITFNTGIFFASLAVQALSGAFSKPKVPSAAAGSIASQAQDRLHTIRSAVETRKLVFGEVMTSGPLAFAASTGASNEYLHLVILLCEGPIEQIGDVYLNDEKVGALDASGNVTDGRFSGYVRIKKHLGETDQAADADLIAEVNQWTENHNLFGIAYIYIRLKYNSDVFPDGIPNVRGVNKGTLLFDPRTDLTQWSNNVALCWRTYQTARYGLSYTDDEINDPALIAAANICDERVLMASHTVDFTVDASTDKLTFSAGDDLIYETGDGIRLSSTGTLPAPLAALTTYYVIRVDKDEIKLASTYANALSGAAIDITNAGSGIHTADHYDQVRYTANGIIDLGNKPVDILSQLATAAAGANVYSQGVNSFYAGAYVAPTFRAITPDDLRGPMQIMPKMARKDLYNAVRGTFVDPQRFWQPSDFPMVTNSVYEDEDGMQQITRDIDLPFTTNSIRAQRIAKIHLDKSRQSITVNLPCKITCFEVIVWSTVYLDFPDLGWDNKEFKVLKWAIVNGGIDLTLQEEAAASYDWDKGNATIVDPAPNTNLPNAFTVQPPGTPTVIEELYETTNSVGVRSRAIISWTASPDAFVISYQPEYKLSSDTDWIVLPRINNTSIRIDDTAPGDYDFRVKAINVLGAASAYSSASKTILGLTAQPSDVSGFNVIASNGFAQFDWALIDDLDVRIGGRVVVRHSPDDIDTATWEGGTVIKEFHGNQVTGIGPLMTGTYMIKALDSSGNYSANAASFEATEGMVTGFTTVSTLTEHPDFTGSRTNINLFGSGIILGSTTLIDDMTTMIDDWTYIDEIGTISADGSYGFHQVMDLTTVATRRFESHIKALSYDIGDTIDQRLTNIDTWDDFDGAVVNDCNAILYARTTNDNPAGSPVNWSAWTQFRVADFTCRAVEFKLDLATGNSSHNILVSELSVTAKVPV
jgi:hypothetical protein